MAANGKRIRWTLLAGLEPYAETLRLNISVLLQ
jgi:hypothetical protein